MKPNSIRNKLIYVNYIDAPHWDWDKKPVVLSEFFDQNTEKVKRLKKTIKVIIDNLEEYQAKDNKFKYLEIYNEGMNTILLQSNNSYYKLQDLIIIHHIQLENLKENVLKYKEVFNSKNQDLLNKIIILNNVQNNTTNNIVKIEFSLDERNMRYEIRFRVGIGLAIGNRKIDEMISDWNYLNFLATNWEQFIINNLYGKHND